MAEMLKLLRFVEVFARGELVVDEGDTSGVGCTVCTAAAGTGAGVGSGADASTGCGGTAAK